MPYKIERAQEDMKRVISNIIDNELKNPDVTGMISIMKIKITPDLKFAKIYVSTLEKNKSKVINGLNKSSGFIRKVASQKLNLRVMPQLNFVIDDSIEYGIHMNTIINNLNIKKEDISETKEENK